MTQLSTADEIRIGRVLRKSLEWICALGPIFLGLAFAMWPHIFEAPLYEPIRFLPAQFWGVLYLVLGVTRCVFLWINGHYYPSPTARRVLAFLTLFIVWLPMIMLFWTEAVLDLAMGEGKFLPGAVGFPLLAAVELVNIFWLGVWLAHRREVAGYE